MKKYLSYSKSLLSHMALAAFLLLSCISSGQINYTNEGTNFWFGFPGDCDTTIATFAVNITSFLNASGTFTIPGAAYTQIFTVIPGTVTRFTIPYGHGNDSVPFTDGEGIASQACHIVSNNLIAPYISEESGGPRDGDTYLLPDTLFGNDYYVMSYQLPGGSTSPLNQSEFNVVTPGNSVTVLITPTAATSAGHPAGTTYTETVGPEKCTSAGAAGTGDLTGTHITAATPSDLTQKFAVVGACDIGGAGCTNTVDGMFNELIPTYTWGKNYIFVSTEGIDDLCRILASTNGTQVKINGTSIGTTLNTGQYYQTTVTTSTPAFITANNPISVGRILQTEACNGYATVAPGYPGYAEGDADLSILMPNEDMYIDSVTFYSNLINQIQRNFLQIITRTSDVSTFKLDGVSIPSSKFHTLAYNPTYSFDTEYVSASTGNGTYHEIVTTGCGFIGYASGLGSLASSCSTAGVFLHVATGGVASATYQPATCSACDGTATANIVGGVPPYTYLWSDANSQTTPEATGLCAGTYTVVIQGKCDIDNDTAIVVIPNSNQVAASFSPIFDSINSGGVVNFASISNGATSYTWNFGDGVSTTSIDSTVSHEYTRLGIFVVSMVAINSSGCTDTVLGDVFVKEEIKVPNVFTPNGDNINDEFVVATEGMQTYDIQIFDRWGKKVFESESPGNSWTGKNASGEMEADGIYYYVVKAADYAGKAYNLDGYLQLIRGE